MWERLFHNKWFLATLSGFFVFIAFEQFNFVPLVILFPVFFHLLASRCHTFWSGFRWGFFVSFIIMLGGFYWIVYVIHEFGFLPWSVSALLFLGFCGFGALNFPLYLGAATVLGRKIELERRPQWWLVVWFTLALPALFTGIEFLIPKLFPWYVGHCLYRMVWLTQISEITGSSYMTFMLFSVGSTIGLLWQPVRSGERPWYAITVPVILVSFALGFSAFRFANPPELSRNLTVAMIQPNIGSLARFEAQRGIGRRVRSVVDIYKQMTSDLLKREPKPDLILWPETAMPFHIERNGEFPNEVRNSVLEWKVPLITGAYAPSPNQIMVDYNAAYLLEPMPDNTLHIDHYKKNILLAFGEYMPFGEIWPQLYEWAPAVSHFGRGTEQNHFTLRDGTKIGATICYEMIVPEFYRKVVKSGVNAVVNLTNDSWFGPTSEPYLHGSLTIFRAIEARVPFWRVTNTGTSFAVDAMGRVSSMTPVYKEDTLTVSLPIPATPPQTFYVMNGDWFIVFCGILILFTLIPVVGKKNAPVLV
jgi:apolipoprotein N-acyltransferase